MTGGFWKGSFWKGVFGLGDFWNWVVFGLGAGAYLGGFLVGAFGRGLMEVNYIY